MSNRKVSSIVMPNPIRIYRRFGLPRLFFLSLIFLIASLLFFYVFQVNMMIRETSIINNYELKLSNLSKENNNLEVAFSRRNSLRNMEEKLEEMEFEKVVKVDYIRVLETSMAAR